MSDLGQRMSVRDMIHNDQHFSLGERLLVLAGCVSVVVLFVAAFGG